MSKESFSEKMSAIAEKIDGILLNYAETGWIDSVSKVLIFIENSKAEELIQKFPESVQQMMRDKLKFYSENPEKAYSTILSVMNEYDDSGVEVYEDLCKELHTIPFYEADKIINLTCKKNVILAEKIKSNRFIFDDILTLDDRSIQKILREVDSQELAKALKSSSEEVRQKIFRNMSKRAASMLQEDMEFMGPVRKKDSIDAQNKIIGIILELERLQELITDRLSNEMLVL